MSKMFKNYVDDIKVWDKFSFIPGWPQLTNYVDQGIKLRTSCILGVLVRVTTAMMKHHDQE